MKLRKIKKEELQEAKNIYEEAFQKTIKNLENPKNTFVLINKNKILGLCQINYIKDNFTNKQTAYLNNICIKKEYQNQGLGTILLNTIEKTIAKKGTSKIMLTSNKKRTIANKLYKKQNYEKNKSNLYTKELNKKWKIFIKKC